MAFADELKKLTIETLIYNGSRQRTQPRDEKSRLDGKARTYDHDRARVLTTAKYVKQKIPTSR
jgi:hypothetical protein